MTKKKVIIFKSEKTNTPVRLDVFLSEKLKKTSRSGVQELIRAGAVLLNGRGAKKTGERLRPGDRIEIQVIAQKIDDKKKKEMDEPAILPEVPVFAETDDYIVVNKPAGLLVHETEAHEPVTLARWLLEKYPEIKDVGEDPVRPGIVHRLDREASGVLVVAKTQAMFETLKQQFKDRTVEKEYVVLVHDIVEADHASLDFAIDRGPDGRMVARPKTNTLSLRGAAKAQPGKEAVTEFLVEKRFARFTLLDVRIHTGRMHQIRVHMLAYNHPVVGDTLYVNKKLNLKRDRELGRLFLHAKRLCFNDLQGQRVCVEAPLPESLAQFLTKLN